MKQSFTVLSLLSASILLLSVIGGNQIAHSKSAGALFPKSCTSCHIGIVNTTPNLSFNVIDTTTQQQPTSFNPGQVYAVEVTIKDPVFNVFGYTLAADSGHFYISEIDSMSQVKMINGEHATHTKKGILGANNEITWLVYWKAPDLAPDSIHLKVYVLAADGDATENGDVTYYAGKLLMHTYKTGMHSTSKRLEPVSAYPNPVSDQLTINLHGAASVINSIQLFDIKGTQVSSVDISQLTDTQQEVVVNIEQLPSGVYFLNIQSDEGTKTLKVLVN